MRQYIVKVYKGHTEWYNTSNQKHREDGPAVEYANGNKHWFLNGKLHREDGPACEDASGHKAWYLNGKPHREDGPAVEYTDGTKEWWFNGKLYTEAEFKAKQNPIPETCEGKVVEIDGKKYKLTSI